MHATISPQPGERFSSFSSASAFPGGFPQLLHVAHGWDAEEAFVLPIEVGGVVVAHAIGSTCRVQVFAQHQTAGLLQPQLLLELQGAHRRDSLEVVVETRDAHWNLFTCFSVAHLEDLQNQTIIFDNHSTTLCSRASII